MFADRLRRVLKEKEDREESIQQRQQRQMSLATQDAERDLPKIVAAIEEASRKGRWFWETRINWPEDLVRERAACRDPGDPVAASVYVQAYTAYVAAYRDRVIALIANDAFAITTGMVESSDWRLRIKW